MQQQPARVELTDPTPDDPRPVQGCAVCQALIKQRRMAMEKGSPAYNPSHAVDLAIEVRRHPHGRARA